MRWWLVEMNDATYVEVEAEEEAEAMNIAEDIRAESGDPEWAVGAEPNRAPTDY
jgi:hypothetical protein